MLRPVTPGTDLTVMLQMHPSPQMATSLTLPVSQSTKHGSAVAAGMLQVSAALTTPLLCHLLDKGWAVGAKQTARGRV